MRSFLIPLLCLLSHVGFTQEQAAYEALTEAAFQAFQEAAPRKAVKLYRKAFALGQGRTVDILRAAAASHQAKKTKLGNDFLEEGFQKEPLKMAMLFLHEPEFQALQNGLMLKAVKKQTIIALRDHLIPRDQPLFTPGKFEVPDLDYAFHVSLASYFFKQKAYQEALRHYQDAFSVKNTNVHSLLRASVAAAFSEQQEVTQEFLAKAFAKISAYALTYVRLHEDFKEGFNNPMFLEALNQQIVKQFPDFDPALTLFIDEVWAEFARYRRYNPFPNANSNTVIREACTARIVNPALQAQKDSLHQLTFDKLDSLFSAVGVPTTAQVADRKILVYAMLRGANTSFLDKHWDKIVAGVDSNQVRDFRMLGAIFTIARAYDNACIEEGKKQRYGTVFLYPETVRKAEPINYWPVEDPASVDQRRAAIGLPPIKTRKAGPFEGSFMLAEQLRYQGFPKDFTLLDTYYEPYPIDPIRAAYSKTYKRRLR